MPVALPFTVSARIWLKCCFALWPWIAVYLLVVRRSAQHVPLHGPRDWVLVAVCVILILAVPLLFIMASHSVEFSADHIQVVKYGGLITRCYLRGELRAAALSPSQWKHGEQITLEFADGWSHTVARLGVRNWRRLLDYLQQRQLLRA